MCLLPCLPCYILFLVEATPGSVWESLQQVQDPELRRLTNALPHTLLQSRADSTTKKYLAAFDRWKRWADHQAEVAVYPILEAHFALYLQHLAESTESKAAVEEAVNAVSWVQQLSDNQPVSTSPFIKTTLSGLQRILAKPKKRKEPITAAMLARMVSSLGQAPSLSDVRLVASSLLAYAGFLRYDEVARLCCCDVQIGPDSMSIHVTSSKTDQLRQGDHVLISRTNTPTCPVAMMEWYIQAAGISLASKLRLFRAITSTKKGECLRAGGSLSYTRMRELLLKKLTDLGYDKSCFSLHSLRAGGATAAANAGVPDRLFKRHGRWKSESAKDGYVKDSVDALLSVSKNLDL